MKDQELLWKYVSGECTAQEEELLKKRLKTDKTLQQEWQRVKATHDSLKQLPLEKPSMRFAKNVMEAIQEQALATGNLINQSILKNLIGGLVLVSMAIYWIFSRSFGNITDAPLVRDTVHRFNELLTAIPAKGIFYLFSTIAAIMLLFVVDRLLNERITGKAGQRPRN
ncbi:MAG: hypothetical protein Kow0027_05120 [Saprospiraceae bacterium]